MRRPEYLSPSSMSKWSQDPQAYYLKYLSDNKIGDEPQNRAMAVGSAFDAYVKSFLYEHVFGKPNAPGNDPTFELDRIFEDQVAVPHRDFGREAATHLLAWYRHLGTLDQLMLDLGRSKGPPKFEMDVRGSTSHGRNGTVQSVPFRVKPDLCYVNEHDATVVLDWKVNGYLSTAGVSPMKGFVRARRSGKLPWSHDECTLGTHRGLTVNVAAGLEKYNEDWARQCAVGGWMFGQPVGAQFVVCIHQLACRPGVGKPNLTVAEHVCFVTKDYQERIHDEAVLMWETINSDHVFRNVSKEDSQELCRVLDQRKETLALGGQGFIAPGSD